MQVKASILGHFGENKNLLNGQTIKTKIITEELQNQLGQNQVLTIDTYGGWKTLLKAPFQVFKALKNSKNVLIFPAHNGLRIYAPLLSFCRQFFKNRKLHYVVIGGWLPQFLVKRKSLAKTLKKFDGIYVETSTMKKALEKQGFQNVFVMPNCKKLTVLSENELIYPSGAPYKLCTFSRVNRKKGIEDAINVVKAVNEKCGKTVYSLDIYGDVDVGEDEWFENLKQSFPEYVAYKGSVPFDKSVKVLKPYFALLFPTHYWTEGIPGTIIDAYAAGVPVISARWESFADLVDDGITGIGYAFDNTEELEGKLIDIANAPHKLNALKMECLKKSESYVPGKVIKTIISHLG